MFRFFFQMSGPRLPVHSRVFFSMLTPAMFHTIVFVLSMALGGFAASGDLRAQDASTSATVTSLTVGFQGSGRVGSWLPIRIQVAGVPANLPVSLFVAAPDPRGDLCESLVASGNADASGSITLEGVFSVGRLDGSVVVLLRNESGANLWKQTIQCEESAGPTSGDKRASQRDPSGTSANAASQPDEIASRLLLMRHAPLTVLTTGQPAGLQELRDKLQSSEGTRDALVLLNLPSAAQLPAQIRALDSLDAMVLVSDFSINQAQATAIRGWVLSGGHLIISCGSGVAELLASPLGQWIQPKFEIPADNNTLQTLDLTPVQNYVIGATALQTNRNAVTVMRLPSVQPKVLVQSINGPMIARAAAGAGLITAVGLDLNSRPLDKWLSLPQLHETMLFGRILDSTTGQGRVGSRIASVGVNDISTQLAAVSDAIPPEERWSTGHIMLLLLALTLLVGPLDYFLVVRTLKSPRLTWFTFPTLVGTVCIVVWLVSASHRSPQTVRQVGLLDLYQDGEQQVARARTWSSLSTTETQYGSVSSKNNAWLTGLPQVAAEQVLSWSGRVEDVYGGMYRPGGAGLGQYESRRSDPAPSQFSAVPLLADGSTSFLADVRDEVNGRQLFSSELILPPSSLLEGSFVHQLPVSIRNWIVVCGNRVYAPSDKASDEDRELLPNETWSRHGGKIRVTEIRDFLRGVRLLENTNSRNELNQSNVTQSQTPYDINSRNPLDILLMTSLYHSAGGEIFVGLQNDGLRRDEVSDTIVLNEAMLIGVADLPLSQLQLNDQALTPVRTETVVRLFLPVARVATAATDQANPKEE